MWISLRGLHDNDNESDNRTHYDHDNVIDDNEDNNDLERLIMLIIMSHVS